MSDLDLDAMERDAITLGAGQILALIARVRELEAATMPDDIIASYEAGVAAERKRCAEVARLAGVVEEDALALKIADAIERGDV